MVKSKDPDPGSRSKMNIAEHISESLETIVWFQMLKFFDADADPGSGNLVDPRSGIRDGKIRIRDKRPGSATML
jgi:hypothetical protein